VSVNASHTEKFCNTRWCLLNPKSVKAMSFKSRVYCIPIEALAGFYPASLLLCHN
jgi:hypothetical protein